MRPPPIRNPTFYDGRRRGTWGLVDLRHRTTLHGVLVKVFDHGVLIVGESQSGKSSCALELVHRGHALIADDVVEIERIGDRLIGSAPMRFRGLLEVRSLGIIDVRTIFGEKAFAPEAGIDLCIMLADRGQMAGPIDLTGGGSTCELLGVQMPMFAITGPQTNLYVVIETALKMGGREPLTAAVFEDHDKLVAGAFSSN